MESFSFLKYLRGGVVAGAQRAPAVAAATTTIAASASACEDGGGGDGNDDDASFFDLEFAVPGDESAASDAEEERVEFNFAVAAGEDVVAPGAAKAVAVDAPAAEAETEAEAAVVPPPATLLRPATRFRVLLLKLRKPKAPATADGAGATQAPRQQPAASRFLIKFRVEDAPLASSRATTARAPRTPSLCLAPRPPWASAATLRPHAAVGMHSDIAAPSRTAIVTIPPPPLGRADALRRRRLNAQARTGLYRPSIAPPPCCRRPTPLLPPYAMSTLKSYPRGRPQVAD
ncbi:uncharacterized protein [Miscanthus floridulus]|uniref:uncharacterized protein isoform X2 n=1 Tax=Miscanthus floridulus TaxID=154761 RepID=UPI0034574DE6